MKFVEFLENRFQEVQFENESKNAFNLLLDSEVKAIHEILTRTRELAKLALIPKVLLDYVLVSLGKRKEPEPVLLNRLKEQREKELEKKVSTLQAVSNGVQSEA